MAERLLAERLSADQQAWGAQFESLLRRIHTQMASFNPDEIEADISAAATQVKAKRRAAR